MSAAVLAACFCSTIGAPEEIRFCAEHHRYFYGDRRLASFSQMLRTVYPQKQAELEKIPPEVLEHARERGIRVDRYASEFLLTGEVTIDTGEWQEVQDRTGFFVDWCERVRPEVRSVQEIVYSLEDGLAATMDFRLVLDHAPIIVDMKNTASPDWTWKVQLGCHARYSGLANVYVLHVNPGLYKKTGLKLIPYDLLECVTMFEAALAWWKVLKVVQKNE